MAETGRALADREAAPLAEIVAPGVGIVRRRFWLRCRLRLWNICEFTKAGVSASGKRICE